MIDHIGLFVADAAKRADFYEKLLAPLGYVKKVAYPTAVCFANDEDGDGIWLESPKDGNPVVPSHVAFRAKTADAIKAFHEAGLAAGGAVDEIIDRAPPVVAGGYAEADRV